MLQDVAEVDAWTLWGAAWRDLYLLDGENRLLTVYNLTEHDLGDPANQAELNALIDEAWSELP